MKIKKHSSLSRVVHIVSGDRWAGAEVQAFTLFCELNKKTALHVIILNDGELARQLQDNNIPVTIINESHHNSLTILLKLMRKLQEIKPHIVHTHRQKENILGSVANLLSSRARCLRTAHGAPEFRAKGKQWLQVKLDNICGALLQQAIIAVSADLAQRLELTFNKQCIHTITNGINKDEVLKDLHTPIFKKEHPLAKHIGFVGRIEAVKRVDLFIEMAAILKRQHPDTPYRFHIFGDGDLYDDMQKYSIKLGIDDSITFHGHRNDIRSCISGLDVIVMPSDHEGLPMTALEAVTLGKPLVAHAIGGLLELYCDQMNYLSRDHTPEDYSKLCYSAINSNFEIQTLPEKYTAKHNMEKTLALYENLLTRS